jgi:hypothetical protein
MAKSKSLSGFARVPAATLLRLGALVLSTAIVLGMPQPMPASHFPAIRRILQYCTRVPTAAMN